MKLNEQQIKLACSKNQLIKYLMQNIKQKHADRRNTQKRRFDTLCGLFFLYFLFYFHFHFLTSYKL